MASGDLDLLRRGWDAVARGDLDAVSDLFDPRVRWRGADGEEHDGCHDREEALAFIRRALDDGVTSELLDLREVGDHIVASLQTHTPAEWGPDREPHGELITLRAGKVAQMVVYPTVDDALAAARAALR